MESDKVRIMALDNGPYLVTGEVEVVDAEGHAFTLSGKNIALCRCGASATKPFCDGTHSRLGFKAAECALPQSKAS